MAQQARPLHHPLLTQHPNTCGYRSHHPTPLHPQGANLAGSPASEMMDQTQCVCRPCLADEHTGAHANCMWLHCCSWSPQSCQPQLQTIPDHSRSNPGARLQPNPWQWQVGVCCPVGTGSHCCSYHCCEAPPQPPLNRASQTVDRASLGQTRTAARAVCCLCCRQLPMGHTVGGMQLLQCTAVPPWQGREAVLLLLLVAAAACGSKGSAGHGQCHRG
jgi:hypothetical protein